MKKYILLLIVLLLVFTPYLKADRGHIYFNGGILADDSLSFDPYFWTIASSVDLPINDSFSISPELNAITYKMKFDTFWFEGAVLANMNFDGFFVGGGLTKWFLIMNKSSGGHTDFALKLNMGFKSKNSMLKVYLITPFNALFKKGMIVGATVGIGF